MFGIRVITIMIITKKVIVIVVVAVVDKHQHAVIVVSNMSHQMYIYNYVSIYVVSTTVFMSTCSPRLTCFKRC